MLIHHELRTTHKENASCEDNTVRILDVTRPSAKETNFIHRQMTDEVLHQVDVDDLFGPETNIDLDSTQSNIIAYIAGFIIRKLEEKKRMVLANLKDSQNISNLINLKDRGRLIMPASYMIEVCKKVEQQIQLHEKELLLLGKLTAVENEILHNVEDGIDFEFWDAHVLELVIKT